MNQKSKSTLEKFSKILKLRNYSDRTIEIYSYYVKEMLDSFDVPGLHITANDIKQYVYYYNYSSIAKQNQVYSAIKLYCKYILNIKYLKKVFLERPRKEKKLPRVIDRNHILNAIENINNLKHKSIIMLAYSVGLRVSEVVNLKIKDIDSNRMIITIRQSKGKKDRIVPLSENVLETLRKYFRIYKPKEYLFNGQSDLKYTANSCNKIVKKYLGKDYHFHLLRHSSFTHMLESGTDLSIIQKVAGHKRSSTTQIYAHISNKLLQEVAVAI